MIKAIWSFIEKHLLTPARITPAFRYVQVEHNYGTPKFLLVLQIGFDLNRSGVMKWRLADEADFAQHMAVWGVFIESLQGQVDFQYTNLSGDLRNIRHQIEHDFNDIVKYYFVLVGRIKETDEWREVTSSDFETPSTFVGIYNTLY